MIYFLKKLFSFNQQRWEEVGGVTLAATVSPLRTEKVSMISLCSAFSLSDSGTSCLLRIDFFTEWHTCQFLFIFCDMLVDDVVCSLTLAEVLITALAVPVSCSVDMCAAVGLLDVCPFVHVKKKTLFQEPWLLCIFSMATCSLLKSDSYLIASVHLQHVRMISHSLYWRYSINKCATKRQ